MATVEWSEAGLSLDTRVEPSELDIQADRQLVEQVLINLLQNSQHALEGIAHGEVALTGRLNQRGHVTIEVTDNGPGIADDVAARMFVPFYTTRKAGSGVGLALSRQIMNAHGGTISFANSSGGGARFSLAF
jgi:signal transduction histidine kinase